MWIMPSDVFLSDRERQQNLLVSVSTMAASAMVLRAAHSLDQRGWPVRGIPEPRA